MHSLPKPAWISPRFAFVAGLPFYGRASQASMPGDDLADRGVSGWVSWSVHPGVTLNLTVARSVPYELTTVRAGIAFDLSRPFSRRPRW